LRDVVIFELQFLARRMRCIDDEYVGPFDEPLENLLRARRFEIDGGANAIVADRTAKVSPEKGGDLAVQPNLERAAAAAG
jgi:hypothetical protein